MGAPRTGLLLVNVGTPDSPRTADVRRYLAEFLSDPRVIDIHPVKRWLLLNLIILRLRPRQSAEAYAKVWTDHGSPLLALSRDLVAKLEQQLGPSVKVGLGMRYGNPSIAEALESMRRDGVGRIVVFPMYPQYSSAATGSSVQKVFECASELWNVPDLQVVPPFYDHPAFIECCAAVARPYVERAAGEKVYFSFHGLPQRHVRKSDDTGSHCLEREDCCERMVEANRSCYRAQCFTTARLLAEALGLPEERRVVCFQSRLGRDPWIRPYTDLLIEEAARNGDRHAVMLSPAFVTDCLETIEELGMRAVESWKQAGGESLEVVPCLNARDDWVTALLTIARDHTTWLGRAGDRAEVTT